MFTRPLLAVGAVALLGLAGCIEDTGANGSSAKFGSGKNSKGENVTGSINRRDNGSMVFVVSDVGVSCTAVFATPADKASGDLNCTDGSRGNAVLRLETDGAPKLVAYFRGAAGSGSVTF